MKTLQEQLKSQIDKLATRLKNSRERLLDWKETVAEQEQEFDRLQNALAALEGNSVMIKNTVLDLAHRWEPGKAIEVDSIPRNGKEVTLNGEKVILEPGQRIGKNSFGEECIMPVEMGDFPLLTEPTKASKIATPILPAVESDAGFDKPEDLI